MLKAKAKKDSRFAPIISCSGVSFFRDWWVNVPPGFEVEAKANEFLVTKEFEDEAPEVVEPVIEKKAEVVEEETEIIEPVVEEEIEIAEPIEVPAKATKPGATEEALKLIRDMKLKLSWIDGTGKDGKVLIKDVEAYLASAKVEK